LLNEIRSVEANKHARLATRSLKSACALSLFQCVGENLWLPGAFHDLYGPDLTVVSLATSPSESITSAVAGGCNAL